MPDSDPGRAGTCPPMQDLLAACAAARAISTPPWHPPAAPGRSALPARHPAPVEAAPDGAGPINPPQDGDTARAA